MQPFAEFPSPGLRDALQLRGFRVGRSNVPAGNTTAFGRRHFYKIVLSVGHVRMQYGNQAITLEGAYLFFANPRVPYSAQILSAQQTGYSCVFTDSFLQPLAHSASLQHSPLVSVSDAPFFQLDEPAQARLSGIFELMLAENAGDYRYRDDLMRTYIQLIVHEALRLRPAAHFVPYTTALARVAGQFLELLERQFPVENLQAPLQLRSAQDYAARLGLHVNYLNRAVKQTTGQSTTTHLAARVTAEARALLQHTEWSVADIAYALGFEYPNYFSSFIKKMTGHTPGFYRAR